jgi:hypothetical protein
LEKGITFTKDLRINHPTNVSTRSHSGNNPKELTTDVRVIWTTKNQNQFANEGEIIEKQDMFQEIDQELLSSKHTFPLGQLMHLAFDLK